MDEKIQPPWGEGGWEKIIASVKSRRFKGYKYELKLSLPDYDLTITDSMKPITQNPKPYITLDLVV